MSTHPFKLRVRNAAQVVTVASHGKPFKRGTEMNSLDILTNATIIVDSEGKIFAVDTEENLQKESWYKTGQFLQDIDARGKSVVPGFVDGHTHPVWSGDRVHEFEMKLRGATYMEIHHAGGGIGFTVKHTKDSSQGELENLLKSRLDRMLKQGTVLVEAKSGYGLETATEMKMLKVLHTVNKSHLVDISATYLGAHSVPKDKSLEEATDDIIQNQLPKLKELREKGEISPDNIDVFFEKGVYDRPSTEKILKAGAELGLSLNFHGDEIHPVGAGELAGSLKARAVSHCERVTEEGIKAMAQNDVFGVLLPTTAYVLRIEPPPARKMIDNNVPIALGSDFNPNAHSLSMPCVMNLACVLMKMTLPEALVASTLNAAASINKSDMYGSIERGKWANIVLLNHSDWRHVIYEMVDPPIESVWIRGQLAHS